MVIILVCRALGSALADPLEAEDPPLEEKRLKYVAPKKIAIEKAHNSSVY